jgi:predicted transposase/invertase (TIGR01784 family)
MSNIEGNTNSKENKKYPPTNDLVFKKLFGEDRQITRDALVILINEIVGLKGENKIKTVELLNPYVVADLNQKRPVLDIKAKSENGIKYNVEMQLAPQDYYSARALYYWAKLYTQDLEPGKANNYRELSKTIGIHILDFEYYEGDAVYKKHQMHYGENNNSFEEIEMHTIELPKFNNNNISNYHDTLSIIIAFLKDPEFVHKNRDKLTKEQLQDLDILYTNYIQMHFTKKEKEMFDDHDKSIKDEANRLETALNRGIRQGITEGEKQGIEKMQKFVDQAKEEKVKAEEEKMKAEEEKMKAKEEKVKAEEEKMKAEHKAKEEKLAIVRNMIEDNEAVEKIMKYTGFTAKEIELIKGKNQ